ncbi:MAG: HAMP domain-containing histidine kinase [Candidatus Azobacteroides sp.]|nr:HAMP domain-containing histidine kinase [Candidatus Azobacteroides sp.]
MWRHEIIYKKNRLLPIIIISIILVLVLLGYSLYSQYTYLSKIVFTSYNESLNTAINSYRSYRFDKMFVSDTISLELTNLNNTEKNTPKNITIDELMYQINGVLIASTPFELYQLDSIYTSILHEKEIETKFCIVAFKHKTDSVLEQTGTQNKIKYKFYTSRKELDSERDVQVYFSNPVSLILKEMLFSFVFSFIMLVVIVIALIYQSLIISKQKKIETIRQDFVDSMTHELRHPLQGALSLSEILTNDKILEDNSLRKNIIGRLKTNLQSLETLLHSLVIQSFAEKLQTTANRQQGNLKNRIDEIIATCSISNTKLIHFTTHYSGDVSHCWFDPIHFPNAIKNLIENSIKYSNEEVTIEINAYIKDKMLEVEVKDNGIGIRDEDLPNIFQKFYKGNSNKKNDGFGLGLSYVKWVCEIHDGQVTVTSKVGEGSDFKLIIPLFNS